ncbi:UDP-N-acetylmuramate dehydrogenase [Mesobacillus subterraneus]|uniref:UDP-N-acetylmuramate dehydrogenase n=1 Tax=Mesobacillus subterraneus TaxID=285983 RepID=UPI00203E4D6E|nr:UDP-N-acetylmuramate dehydrogenase [Mesobacillus subterraneus]MCM3665722.1 UDP-N-acetylmuramate dehydrogenase [Mesobacillus subterraneus]MCM3684467.1 UDP-N-acetylmuramate dehydrogenase [Mesobacillus subterraneus]
MKDLADKLRELNIGSVKENEPLANHTTMKIGGPADILIEPSSIDNLKIAVDALKESGIKWTVIGRGSNLLVSDNGIEGAVIKLGSGLDELEIEDTKVLAGGGLSLVNFAITISRKGLSGLEFAGGIPGSVGGAVYMNAGAHGSDISQILEKAYVLFEDGSLEWLSNEEMKFSYRTSVLQKERPGIVVAAVFQMKEGNREEIVAELQKNKDYRKETQPYNYPSCGSVFRNPLPNYAGNLIEKSGLKGHRIGGAQISELHANFIVNTGNAKAEDVLGLIQHVKDTVMELHGVKMETEVEIIGRK